MGTYNNTKLTKDVFNFVHFVRDRFPTMVHQEIADYVKGKIDVKLSSGTVGTALKFDTYEDLIEYRKIKREKKYKSVTEQKDETPILDGISAVNYEETKEEDTQEETEISLFTCLEALFTQYMTAPHVGRDYRKDPSEPVAYKLNTITTEIMDANKSVNVHMMQVLDRMEEEHEIILDALFRIKDVLTDILGAIQDGTKFQRELWNDKGGNK